MGLPDVRSLTSELEALQLNLQSCKRKKAWQAALNLVFLTCNSIKLHLVSLNSAAAACVRTSWAFALQLTEHLRDTTSVNIAIAAASQIRNWLLSLILLDRIHNLSLRADTISYNTAGGAVGWKKALWLIPGRPEVSGWQGTKDWKGNDMDAVGLNTVLTSVSRSTNWQRVMSLLASAPEIRVSINIQCLTGCLSVCEREGYWQKAVDLMRLVSSKGLDQNMSPDQKSMSTMVGACGKQSQWKVALFVLGQEMPQRSVLPDAIAFSTAINACSDGTDRWQTALGVLGQLRMSRGLLLKSDDVVSAYQVAMTSCRSRWQLPLSLLQTIRAARASKSGRLGDEACINAAISAYGCNHWQKAVEFSMCCQTQPNLIGLNSAINACSAPSSHWETAWELQHLEARLRLQIDSRHFQSRGSVSHLVCCVRGAVRFGYKLQHEPHAETHSLSVSIWHTPAHSI